ncbi:MAG: hypothetical protein HYZ10_10305 [Ignavibacteriales bacterium]|nr:hypothetical protein [Ignavibacteriales bacterium]
MDKKSIGVKIHDIHHGLIQSTGAIVESELSFLKTLGAAIQISTIIKDHEIIKEPKTLYAAAGELKISRALSKEALQELEKMNYVRLKYDTGKVNIKQIEVIIPSLPQVYLDFGDYFLSENESGIATGMVTLIDKLSSFPHKEKDIVSSLKLNSKDYDIIKDIGKKTSILDTYSSPTDSESIIYSPIYWEDNPNAIFDLLSKYSSLDLLELLKKIKNHQGIPDQNLSEKILIDGITLGCFPSLGVNSTSGLRKFVFTPQLGVGKIEKNLLHKARVLISCVRYGENFAGITTIYNPERLISVLSGRGYLKAHTESLKQYEQARNIGLVKIIPYGSRYEVHFIDNEENQKVVDMALEMIQIGEATKYDESEIIAKKLLLPGNLTHPTQTRTHILEDKKVDLSRTTVQRINDLLRGVD